MKWHGQLEVKVTLGGLKRGFLVFPIDASCFG